MFETYGLWVLRMRHATAVRIVAETRYDDIMANGIFSGSYEDTKATMRRAEIREIEWKNAVAAEQEIKFKAINYAYKNWRVS